LFLWRILNAFLIVGTTSAAFDKVKFQPQCRENKVIPLLNIPGANFGGSLIVPRERGR